MSHWKQNRTPGKDQRPAALLPGSVGSAKQIRGQQPRRNDVQEDG